MAKQPLVTQRRRSRERLLQALYQLRVGGEWPGVEALRTAFSISQGPAAREGATLGEAPPEPSSELGQGGGAEEDRDFTERLASLLVDRLEEVDRRIEGASRNWRPDRMAAVDLSVLRLATAELLAETAPVRVIINEAVELARRYGTERSPGFVNGVLDGVARGLQAP